MPDYTRKQLDVDGSYVFPYTHADAVLYTTQNNLDGITSGTETNVKAVLDALDNTYRRLDTNITSLYNSQGKRGFLYLSGTTTTASMELPTQGNDFYVPTLKYDSNGNITTAWQTPASIAASADLSGYLPLTGGTLTGNLTINLEASLLPSIILLRGTDVDTSDDWKLEGSGSGFRIYRRTGSLGTWSNYFHLSATTGTATLGSDTIITSGNVTSYLDGKYVGSYISSQVSGYLVSHPEYSYGTIIPFIYNDLAFLMDRGGHATLYSTTSTDLTLATLTVKTAWASDSLLVSAFNSSPNYFYLDNSTSTETNTDGVIIDLTLPKVYTYTSKFYIDFGCSFGFSKIDVLTRKSSVGGTYTSRASGGNVNMQSLYYLSIAGSSTGFDQIRIHLYNRSSTGGFRVAQIGLINYSSLGLRMTAMSRGIDDAVYRSITPNATNTYSLGSSTAQWNNLYANTIYENGTSLASKYVTLATDLSITGEKTFTGDKRIKFKQSNSADKLGFTLYNSSNVEVGFFEWEASSINARSALTLGQWVSTNTPATPGYLGFKVVDVTTAARYALVTPLLIDAKTPLSLNNTLKTFYFPLQFKNGSTTVLAASSGVVDLSTLIPSYSTQNMSVNGTNYALYTSASSLPTIYAPTALAGTGGYILATNSGKTGVEWVAKPTSNVSTSAVVSSSASGTTQISAAQSDPYYNLIEGSTVARSIRFVAGTGISISAATDGQITITNTAGGGGSITVSSILSSTSTGTSAISGDTLDPYYNLLVNSAVSSSVLFKAGTNISVTAGTDNSITFSNTLTNMSLLTNNLFVNGTQTATTNSWKGKLPAEITSLYNGLTIFYRLPYAGNSSNASLQLYALDGTTTIGANCPVYGGNTRLTTHYPQYSIIRMTYYNGEWRANPYYNTNNNVTQTNSATNDYRPILLGSLSNATYTAIPTTATTNSTYKSSNLVYSPNHGRIYMTGTTADLNRGYYVKYSTTAFLGLCIGSDGVQMGLRDAKNGTWLCYCDDGVGESLKVPGTLIPLVINLAEHCLIAYDSTNQCINFTFT